MAMRPSRREFLRLSAFAAIGGAMAACTAPVAPTGEGAPTAEEGAAPAAETIVLTMVSPAFNEEMLDLFKNQYLPAFQEENPNITVEFAATDWGHINEQLLAAFAAGQGPDLWEHGSSASGASWAASGQALALDDFWATYERKEDYLENALETAYLDGNLYSVPRRMAPSTIFYRKDFFEEAGLDPEVGPETWEEHLEMANALTVRENGDVVRAGHWTPTESWSGIQSGWWPFLYQNGASILNEELTQTAFDSPEGIEAIQWYHDLLWEHEVDVVGGIATGLTSHAVNIGTAAMGYGGVEVLIEAENNFPDVLPNLGVFPPTIRVRPASILAIDRIFISKESEPEESWVWLTFLHRPENLMARYQLGGDMPPTHTFLESELVVESPRLLALLEAAEVGYQWPPSPQWNEFRSFMTSMSEAALTDPGPVAPVIQQFAQEVNSILNS